MSRILQHAHQTLIQALSPQAVVVDATVGNGLDTAFILRHDVIKHVFAFDVQEDAINTARILNPSYKVTWILDTHANVDLYVDACDGVIFNLGFLPGSPSSVTTTKTDVLLALDKLQHILKPNGVIVIVVYPSHPEGILEHLALQEWIQGLTHPFYSYEYKRTYHDTAPYVITIYKQKNSSK
jgi:16S rRNA C1402 N4-methylase RsmH